MDKKTLLRILMWCEILFLAVFVILIVKNLHVDENEVSIILSGWTKGLLIADMTLLFASAEARTIVKYKLELIKYNTMLLTSCIIVGLFIVVLAYFIINVL